MNIPADGELIAILAAIPDPRGRKGRRHPLAAMLAATICGLLTGATGCTAIAQFIRNQEPEFWHALGFTRRPPTTNCYRKLLLKLPAQALENAIRKWATRLIDIEPNQQRGVALDGKTLCGTLQPHGQSIHLLGLLDHATGGVLAQLKMPSTTNEHRAAMTLLKSVDLQGTVLTGDAMFCQRKLCQQIVEDGGDYLITVKDNQPELNKTIASEFNPGLSPLQRTLAPSAA
ncbi:MAG: ISAs1 family transposase [Pirellulaceae bacterium]